MPIDIQSLIAGGENQTVEFKSQVTTPDIIARLISAFANTDGGTILFGINEPHHVTGIQPEQFEIAYHRALKRVSDSVHTEKSIVNFGDRKIGIIFVKKSLLPISAPDGYFVRFGTTTKPMSVQDLSTKATHTSNPNQAIESLAQTVAKQTDEISKLRESFEKANSWKRKALYALIGALATGLAKAVLAAIGVVIG